MPHQCTGCGHTFEDGSKEMLSGCPECGGNKFQFRPAEGSDSGSADDRGETAETSPEGSSAADPPERPEPSSVAETVGRATTKVRDFVSSDPTPSESGSEPNPEAEWPDDWESRAGGSSGATGADSPSSSSPSNPTVSGGDPDPDRVSVPDRRERDESREEDDIIDADARREDAAQASARTDVVSPEELEGNAVADEGSEPLDAPTPNSAPDGEVVSEPTGEEPDLAELREQLNDQFESIKILEPGQYELNLMELYDREEYIIALQENGRYVIQVPEQWIGEDVDDR